MQEQPRVVSFDVGSKRVGIAITDPLRLFVRPVGTYSPEEAIRVLEGLLADEAIEAVVVGWPLRKDGSEGEAVVRVRPFVERITQAAPGISIHRQDERYTSRRATELLVRPDVKPKHRRKRSGRVDAATAVLILEDWLEEN